MVNVMRNWFDKNKQSLFPNITNWSDPQDKLRYEKNVDNLNHKEWFFFHPSAYHLINFSIESSFLLMNLIAFIWGLFNNWIYLCVITGFFILWSVRGLYKKIKNYKYVKDMTFYDLLMREEKEE